MAFDDSLNHDPTRFNLNNNGLIFKGVILHFDQKSGSYVLSKQEKNEKTWGDAPKC